MNLQTIQYSAFRNHARNFLEPAIIHKWNLEQQNIFTQLKKEGAVALAGDMRADTPGMVGLFKSL